MDMNNNNLEVLKRVTGDDFVQIDAQNFKSEYGDAIYLENHDAVVHYIKETVKEEIPYLNNDLLREYLPKKFHNDYILEDYKELCKFDHTILSNLIKDDYMFAYDVMKIISISDLVLIDSEVHRNGDAWIFYLKHELN